MGTDLILDPPRGLTMDSLDYALDLMRRMPPADIEDNLAGLIDLVPDLMESLLSAVDQPLEVRTDPNSGKDYLLCDYNRDGDSYRSPWSNEYDPPLDYDATFPSDSLRALELKANQVFDTYRDLYYEGGVSSVYTWDLDSGFAVVILIKKEGDGTGRRGTKGSWDSIHVVEVSESGSDATYKLTSTIMLSLTTTTPAAGDVTLAGSLTRQNESTGKTDSSQGSDPHIVNIGKMVEEMETKMRMQLESVYFGKTRDIVVGELRQSMGIMDAQRMRNNQAAAIREMQHRGSRGGE